MTFKTWLGIAAISCAIFAGIYFSSQNSERRADMDKISRALGGKLGGSDVVVYVDKEPILWSDIDWEYHFYKASTPQGPQDENGPKNTQALAADGTAKDIEPEQPDSVFALGAKSALGGVKVSDAKLSPLRTEITSNIIERKLLYHYLQMDSQFRFDDPRRYTTCIEEWAQVAGSIPSEQDRERLKSQLCEKSIVDQYVKEVLFKKIAISPEEIAAYYKDNKDQFLLPERVLIRQIVLPSEKEAKKIAYKITSRNFVHYAKTRSITPEAANGGRLGPFARGQMPRIFDVAFTMRRGEIRRILKSTYGFHIIYLERKYPKRQLSQKQAEGQIIETLTRKKQEEVFQKWVELALNAIKITSPKQAG